MHARPSVPPVESCRYTRRSLPFQYAAPEKFAERVGLMAFPDLAANLLYTVLCLVPGFISLQTVRLAADLEMELSEFEKSTWSLIGSGVSLSVLYFGYVALMTIGTGRFRLIHSLDLGWVDLLAVYPLLIGVAVLVGYVSALVIPRTPGRKLSSRSRAAERDEQVPLDEGPNM